jgi:hypothetical protein
LSRSFGDGRASAAITPSATAKEFSDEIDRYVFWYDPSRHVARAGGGVRFAPIGRLDKALDVAQAEGWTVVDMKNDWKTIFPFGAK